MLKKLIQNLHIQNLEKIKKVKIKKNAKINPKILFFEI